MHLLAKGTAAVLTMFAVMLLPALHNASAGGETLLQRGAYLVNVAAACGRCHTPRDAGSTPIAGMEMAGGLEFDDGMLGHVVVPNITPGRSTGIGNWTPAQIVAAIRDGVRPDGTIIGPPMHVLGISRIVGPGCRRNRRVPAYHEADPPLGRK